MFEEVNRDMFEEPNRDSYEETRRRLRAEILGDDWLMDYCLFETARAAIEKGEAACRELVDHCNGDLEEALKVDCGDDPKAMVERTTSLDRRRAMSSWLHPVAKRML